MGRVSRYKKIKSFDPYSKANGGKVQLENIGVWGFGEDGRKPKKRSRTSEKLRAKRKRMAEIPGFDAPPEGGDEFDPNDLFGTVKKQKSDTDELLGKSEKPKRVTVPIATKLEDRKTETKIDEDMESNKVLKIEENLKKNESNQIKMTRIDGETKAAYKRRVRTETRQIIQRERLSSMNAEKRQKKKEFLNQKKKKRKNGEQQMFSDDEPVGAERKLYLRESNTRAQFGEQADRPPTFKNVPRGAKQKSSKKSNKKETMGDAQIEAERRAMESMRRRVQAQYATLKQARRRQGEFHL